MVALLKNEPNESLILSWVGINDCARDDDFSSHMSDLSELHDELYDAGARNFVFVDVPPMQRIPSMSSISERLAPTYRGWNLELQAMVEELRDRHEDASVLIWSSYDCFNCVLDDPKRFGFEEEDPKKEGGGIWFDNIHPSAAVHSIVARELMKFLEEAEARKKW